MANVVRAKRPVKSNPAAKSGRVVKTTDPTVMTYRALMPLQVATEDGTVQKREFGDFVPEVFSWKSPGIWLQTKRIEQVYVNQSEIDAWQERYAERLAEEKAAREEADEREKRLRELREEIALLEATENKPDPDFNAEPKNRDFAPSKTVAEKIDFGAVKMKNGSVPHPVELPKTRAPKIPASTAEKRVKVTKPVLKRPVAMKKV